MDRFLPSGFLAMTAALVSAESLGESSIGWKIVLQLVGFSAFTLAFWLANRKVSR